MLDGEGCLLHVVPRYLDEEHCCMISWLLPKTFQPDFPSQLREGKPCRSEKRKKSRRAKLKSSSETIKTETQVIGKGTKAELVDFPEQMFGKTACHSQQQNLDQIEDASFLPGLDDEIALRCLAFISRSDHGNLALLSRKHLQLVRSPELFQLRCHYGVVEQWVYMYGSGSRGWTAFDPKRNASMILPPTNASPLFDLSDRESLSAGTHLLWIGQEAFDFACYRYDLVSNSWEQGPPMVNPRSLFASASCGEFAFVAGGFANVKLNGMTSGEKDKSSQGWGAGPLNVLTSAERYDSRRGQWDPIPPMKTRRQKCSGVFMDGKFFVIGGKDENHQPLTCGEVYDPAKGTWRTIENMYPAPGTVKGPHEPSPPLLAVADNQLYAIENSTNLLKVYEKPTNTWRILGAVPVRADFCNGWGLAFKALGDELFVIGRYQEDWDGIAVFSWRPQLGAAAPEWQLVNGRITGLGNFLCNCAVMSC